MGIYMVICNLQLATRLWKSFLKSLNRGREDKKKNFDYTMEKGGVCVCAEGYAHLKLFKWNKTIYKCSYK